MIKPQDVDEALDEAQMAVDDRKDQVLPEAPASMTLRVWIKGYGVMLTARDEKVSSLLKKTETMIDYAESHGWKNTWEKEVLVTPVKPKVEDHDAPWCPTHNLPMTLRQGVSKKTGRPYRFYSCTEKLADGTWCQEKG